jgi:uncharacterized protein YbjT (DUF2867 family)
MVRAMGAHVLVIGATGYVGRRLVGELVAAGLRVRCLARTPEKLDAEPWRGDVEVLRGDVTEPGSLGAAFTGIDVVYYLVHSIGAGARWEARDREAARNTAQAAATAGVRQLVYLGGLGDDAARTLSPHLASRHEVGRVLASGPVPVTELRAAVVIGSGSASFEMLRHLVEVLPVMTTPRWVDTRVQPIAVRDVLAYLVGVLDRPEAFGRTFEIGGADVVTYREMMDLYAEAAGLRRRLIVRVPVLSPRLSSLWVGFVTPVPSEIARPLIDSLSNEVVVHDHSIDDVVPHRPLGTREAIERALARVGDLDVTTRWTDAELYGGSPADPMPTDPSWAGGVILTDHQVATAAAPPSAVWTQLCRLGGEHGWLVGNWLWAARGVVDRVFGGAGRRRGRRHPTDLRVGDVVDFWRVEALEPLRRLRLRAEMRLPGQAWLEWELTETASGTRLDQRARFHPRGLWGRAYWLAVTPFHRLIFRPLAERVAAAAEAASGR